VKFLLITLILILTIISCKEDDSLEVIAPIQNFDSLITYTAMLSFRYESKDYRFDNIPVEINNDTILGREFQLPDTVEFFRKYIFITAPLGEKHAINIRIRDVYTPLINCIPEGIIVEFNEGVFTGNPNCYQPNPDISKELCSWMSATLSTKTDNDGIKYEYSKSGYLSIESCDNDLLLSEFDNDFFTNGRLAIHFID
jgi:hypothetical protein